MGVLGILLFAVLGSCVTPPEFVESEWYEATKAYDISRLYEPHVNPDGTFFNPWMPRPELPIFTRMFTSRTKFPDFPAQKYAWQENDYNYLRDTNNTSISFAGHASIIIKMNGETIFADPFFSGRALIIGKDVEIKFDFDKAPEHPVVLISHNHYDHLDTASIEELIKKDAVFIVPLKLKDFFTDLGAREVYELDWWGSVRLGEITYTLLPAQHWSRRFGQGTNETLWGSFLIQGAKTIYFSGDTGYFRGFEEFGKKYAIDYALIGVGAYEPRWFMHYMHMNVAEFFLAAAELNAKTAIPMHFGVISLSDEPLVYPLYAIELFIAAHPEYSDRVKSLRVGEWMEIAP
jgi:L-ascorbate metabolism protein UlaG (beta-lactamase superfamily)